MNKYETYKNSLVQIILGICFVLLIALNSCSKIDSTNPENTSEPQTISAVISDMISVYELIENISSYKSNLGLQKSTLDSISQQTNSHIIIIDSTYADGNGISYSIEFPIYGGVISKSDLNYDNKARYGKITVHTNMDYRELNSQSTFEIDSSVGLVIGQLTGIPTKFKGSFKIARNQIDKISMDISGLNAVKGDKKLSFNGNFTVNWISGAATPGIILDQIQYDGNGTVYLGNSNYNWASTLQLEKNIERGCSSNFVKGVLQISEPNSSSTVSLWRVDFDPFNNRSCDDIAKIYFAGKELEFHVK